MMTTDQSIPGGLLMQPKDYRSVHDRKSLFGVREKYDTLKELMGKVGVKLNDVSNGQEREFLNAYRVHMLNVQLELKELKQKVAKAEESLQDDGEVSKLEDECNWYRGETNRLQANRTTMMKDIKKMRSRLDALGEQQGFLREQLKTVLKKTRVLESEIEIHEGRSIASMPIQEGDEGISPTPRSPHCTLPTISQRRIPTTRKTKKLFASKSKTGLGSNFDPLVPIVTAQSHKGEVIKMRNVSSNYNSSKLSMMNPQEQLEHLQRCRNDFELELERLIKDQYSQVINRRSLAVASNSKSRLNIALGATTDGITELRSHISNDIPKEIEGITGLGTEHLTDTDRYNIMIQFLSQYPIFRAVVQRMIHYQEI
jgi:cell division protein ZapA (FtsZ GTPase activity inhibitor)